MIPTFFFSFLSVLSLVSFLFFVEGFLCFYIIDYRKINSMMPTADQNNECKYEYGWYGFGLPFRPCEGTCKLYEYKELPAIETDKYDGITSLCDLANRIKELSSALVSPIGCAFEIDAATGEFFVDSQGLSWHFNDSAGVYVPFTNKRIVVARTLPEFLARVEMENAISTAATGVWLTYRAAEATRDFSDGIFYSSNPVFGKTLDRNRKEAVWTALKKGLTVKQIAYLQEYYDAF